jgi:hypothetical protein
LSILRDFDESGVAADEFGALARESWTAESEDVNGRIVFAQCAHESPGVQIARRLATRDHHAAGSAACG